MFVRIFALLAVALLPFTSVNACSNIIVSSGASEDSSTMVAYNADSGTLYGSLYHYPAATHPAGTMRDVYEWDTGRYLGQIKEAEVTYNVVGNVNEHGLIIGETTFGGVGSLQHQSAAKIDYGSLIWITLQRSKKAREAIHTISALMAEYGYYSEGESFSIADQKEAWVMEIIGKGEFELGAVWVAHKVPEGYVSAHANQARITTFALDDPENVLYAPDVIDFARKIGLYPDNAPDEEFSFSDVYDAVTFDGARFCEARVWSFFGSIMGEEWADQYLDYALGQNLTNRMPLFVQPAEKVSLMDTMQYMRSHYEGTELDMNGLQFADVGAMTYSPYRAHPLTWESSVDPATGAKSATEKYGYLHERPIATPQTGWNFVAQSRRWMPRQLSGLLWFGTDDSGTTVRVPVYGAATAVPEAFAGRGPQDGVTTPMMKFDMQSAFYVFNLVANWAYSRWDLMYPEVLKAIQAKENKFFADINELDNKVLELLGDNAEEKMPEAIKMVTDYSVSAGNQLVREWADFFGELFVKYRDGYIVTPNSDAKACGCDAASAGYPDAWYDRIATENGAHFAVPAEEEGKLRDASLKPISKQQLLARR